MFMRMYLRLMLSCSHLSPSSVVDAALVRSVSCNLVAAASARCKSSGKCCLAAPCVLQTCTSILEMLHSCRRMLAVSIWVCVLMLVPPPLLLLLLLVSLCRMLRLLLFLPLLSKESLNPFAGWDQAFYLLLFPCFRLLPCVALIGLLPCCSCCCVCVVCVMELTWMFPRYHEKGRLPLSSVVLIKLLLDWTVVLSSLLSCTLLSVGTQICWAQGAQGACWGHNHVVIWHILIWYVRIFAM